MDSVVPQLQRKTSSLDKFGDQIPQLKSFCEEKKVNTGLPVAAGLAGAGLLMLLIYGLELFTLAAFVVYPSMRSVSALSAKAEPKLTKVWLTYWLIFGFFFLIKAMVGTIISFIPFHWWIEVGFFAFLLVPKFDGLNKIYDGYVVPLLSQHSEQLDAFE